MSRRSAAQDVTARSILPPRPLSAPRPGAPSKNGIPWSCLLISLINLLAIVLLLVAFMVKSDKWSKDLASSKRDTAAARADAAAARADAAAAKKSGDTAVGLVQSIGQAINALQTNGTLTPAQAAAIAAQIAAQQAARGAAKAQAGTTPGIPGSRSGGGRSVTPGVLGSATRPVVSQTTPPPHSSSTAGCLLTIQSQVFTLDGTVCPP